MAKYEGYYGAAVGKLFGQSPGQSAMGQASRLAAGGGNIPVTAVYNPNYYTSGKGSGLVDPITGHLTPRGKDVQALQYLRTGQVIDENDLRSTPAGGDIIDNPYTDPNISPEQAQQFIQAWGQNQQPQAVDNPYAQPFHTPDQSIQRFRQEAEIGDALAPYQKARNKDAAAAWAAATKMASKPTTTTRQLLSLQQQFAQQYPDFGQPVQRMDSKQLAELEYTRQLDQARDEYTAATGLPRNNLASIDPKTGKYNYHFTATELASTEKLRSAEVKEQEKARDELLKGVEELSLTPDDPNAQMAYAAKRSLYAQKYGGIPPVAASTNGRFDPLKEYKALVGGAQTPQTTPTTPEQPATPITAMADLGEQEQAFAVLPGGRRIPIRQRVPEKTATSDDALRALLETLKSNPELKQALLQAK